MWDGPAFRKRTGVEVVSAHSEISTKGGRGLDACVLERVVEEE